MALLKVETVTQAIKQIQAHITQFHQSRTETVLLNQALNRICAKTILSLEVLPNFTRSTVDGYAVKYNETQGASETLPTILECIEKIGMGQVPVKTLQSGQCAYVPTGGMLPHGADAVVMIEYTESFQKDHILIYRACSRNENVILMGEDIGLNDPVLKRFQRIDFQAIGLCAGVGITHVEVFAPLKAALISTGDEVFPIDHPIRQGQVHDVNRSLISAVLRSLSIEVIEERLIQDDELELTRVVRTLKDQVDVMILSGGSSQGEKDYTVKVFDTVGNPGVWSHGLSVKPGKPTILGASGACLLIGLPGHPVSALAVFLRVFKTAYLNAFNQEIPTTYARLESNVIANAGKETLIFLQVLLGHKESIAKVIYTKSGLISTLKQANAYMVVPGNLEGYRKDEIVEVNWL